MNTVTPRKPLLRPGYVLTLLEIKNRMRAKFGPYGAGFDPFIDPCAEEAERMLYELASFAMESRQAVGVAIKPQKYGKDSSKYRVCFYNCPSCRHQEVRHPDKHCAGCGRPIEWRY